LPPFNTFIKEHPEDVEVLPASPEAATLLVVAIDAAALEPSEQLTKANNLEAAPAPNTCSAFYSFSCSNCH
jgi:hypothetical protein